MKIIGVGVDIIECSRISAMIEKHGESFVNRVYTDHEITFCQSRLRSTQHFAGRWAAKEAVLKAMGTGWRKGLSWKDLEIRGDSDGRPTVALQGAAKELAGQLSIHEVLIAVSHCREYATAHATAVQHD
ncbi:MAG: holo-ACP synthase [Planctomycetales bacterium]